MKVIVSVDDRACSTLAIEAVRTRQWPVDTKFLVVEVVPRHEVRPPPPPMLMLVLTGVDRPWDRVAHARALVQLAVEMLRSAGLEVHGEVRMGHARREILRVAQEFSADLIVIGSPRTPGWHLSWVGWGGGLASRISASAPCSVDVIRGTGASAMA
jgi:nucleotide-binding universal stress UspA family protein